MGAELSREEHSQLILSEADWKQTGVKPVLDLVWQRDRLVSLKVDRHAREREHSSVKA